MPERKNGVEHAAAVMAVLFLIFFLGLSDNQMVSPLLPLMSREFGMAPGDVGKLVGSAYGVAAACSALFVGPASDRLGRRRFLLWASLLFAFSLLAVTFIREPGLLAASRFLTGLAAGTFSTCAIAYVGDYFPYERRGAAMSVVQSGYFAALVVGVSLGSFLAQWQGWRASFIAFGLMSLAAFWLMLALLPDDGLLMREQDQSPVPLRALQRLTVAFETRERVAAIAAAFFSSAGFMGFILYLGSWLTGVYGLKTSQVGLFFVLVGIASLAGGLAAGPIADKTGKRALSLLSTLALSAALAAIPILGWGVGLFACFLVASLAFASRQGPLQALATELVPREARGALVALRNTASQIGIAFAAVVAGMLYDRTGFTAVGWFSGITTLAAAFCIYLIPEPRARRRSQCG